MEGRFHPPHRPRPVCPRAHAGGRRRVAGDFPRSRRPDGAHRGYFKMVHEGKLETGVAEEIERKYEQFRQEFTVVYRKTLTLSRELASELSYLEQEAASVLVVGVIYELNEIYPGPIVYEYSEEGLDDLLDNLDSFK